METLNNPIDYIQNPKEFTFKWTKELMEQEEIPQELKNFREYWEKTKTFQNSETKDKIINTVKNIPIKFEIDDNGRKNFEFKLNGKKYSFLSFNLGIKEPSNIKQLAKDNQGNPDDYREQRLINEKAQRQIDKNKKGGFHNVNKNEIESILDELGKVSGLQNRKDQYFMFMYLTGIQGDYSLGMNGTSESRRDVVSFQHNSVTYRAAPIWFDSRQDINYLMIGD